MRVAARAELVAEEELLRKFLSGDAAVTRQVERWAGEIIHFKGYGVRDDAREDIIQETLANLWQAASRDDFALRVGLRAFVRRVAMARCIDHLRRSRPMVELTESTADHAPGPYDDLLARDERARIRWAMRQLEDGCREVIRLHFFEELPYAEIAARLGRAEPTLRVRMFNCLNRVRSLIARWEKPRGRR